MRRRRPLSLRPRTTSADRAAARRRRRLEREFHAAIAGRPQNVRDELIEMFTRAA